jgi:hypothetical protein
MVYLNLENAYKENYAFISKSIRGPNHKSIKEQYRQSQKEYQKNNKDKISQNKEEYTAAGEQELERKEKQAFQKEKAIYDKTLSSNCQEQFGYCEQSRAFGYVPGTKTCQDFFKECKDMKGQFTRL